ncbi:transposase [Nocardia testacea]|uniref:transposase n=1 Tax=Nocardia testacea TaxID=248551 RepID=UPI0012F68059|nr:transposase [Nocardia testacea]
MSKETLCRITDKMVEKWQAWSSRPLYEVFVAQFIDAMVKIGHGRVADRPIHAAVGVTVTAEDVLPQSISNTPGRGRHRPPRRRHR